MPQNMDVPKSEVKNFRYDSITIAKIFLLISFLVLSLVSNLSFSFHNYHIVFPQVDAAEFEGPSAENR